MLKQAGEGAAINHRATVATGWLIE